jgi:hypothetical protein
MTYQDPKEVKSPRQTWTLIDVLRDDGKGEHSVAVGEWDGERVLAMRWNGSKDKPIGNPQSRGLPTWFILPEEYNAVLVQTLPRGKQLIAKALLGLD